MIQATFTTPGISCMSCVAKIEDALGDIDGVAETDVDLESRRVRVTFDEGQLGTGGITDILVAAGYEVTDVAV